MLWVLQEVKSAGKAGSGETVLRKSQLSFVLPATSVCCTISEVKSIKVSRMTVSAEQCHFLSPTQMLISFPVAVTLEWDWQRRRKAGGGGGRREMMTGFREQRNDAEEEERGLSGDKM